MVDVPQLLREGGGGLNFMHHPALYYNFFYWRHPFLPCSIRPFPNISMLFSSSPEKLIMVPCNSLQKIFNGWGLKQIFMLKTTSIDNFPTSILPSARLSILPSVCVSMILFFFSRISNLYPKHILTSQSEWWIIQLFYSKFSWLIIIQYFKKFKDQ